MKKLLISLSLLGCIYPAWSEPFAWPAQSTTVRLNNRVITTSWRDGRPYAQRSQVAPVLRLPKEGDLDVDLAQICEEKGVVLKTKPDGSIDANYARPIGEVHESGGGGYYSSSSSTSSQGTRHTKNYTPYKDQRDEYLNTHTVNGRIFNLSTGEYVTGQQNRVYVNGYTTKNGTHVNPVTRSYPSSNSSSPGNFNSGNSGGRGIPGSPNPNP